VSYTVAANTSTASRTGTLTAAGQAVTITQSGACNFAVSPTTQAMAAGGDVATVSVTTTSGCAWTATESTSWITITSGASGTGNGTVSYSVPANTSTSARTGTLTVAGQTVTITQQNAPPAPGVPPNLRIISRAEQGPSLEDRRGGIGAAPAASEQDATVANGWVAAVT
jgi:antitoxin (DNA-binding transcriptional repressor) of toxin-antitoxin stability system